MSVKSWEARPRGRATATMPTAFRPPDPLSASRSTDARVPT